MEVTLNRDILVKAMADLTPIADKSTVLPILTHVFIRVEPGAISLVATDLELGLKIDNVDESISVTTMGTVALPARKLFEIAKAMDNPSISISVNDKFRAKITSGSSRFELPGLSPEDFPTWEFPDDSAEWSSTNAGSFLDLMKLVIFAGSNDDSRYNLNSILFEVADGKLRLVATDGHRLSQLDTGIEVKSEDKKYIVPKKSAMAIMNFLKGKEGNILILLTPKNIYLDTPNATIRSRLVEGEYPDYTKVVPLGSFEPILVVLDDLKSSAGICNLMTSDRNRGVNIVVGAGSLDMSATHPDWGTAQNTIDVEYIGERVECILNGAYLTDALSAFAVDKILLEYRNKDAPVIFRSIQPTPTNYFSLIMPMRR